ncbi:TspO/MBR family protein [Liquorilactobacillus oeni]|nr:TspO/MBR family protein [Liquorilactobacillus oeni]
MKKRIHNLFYLLLAIILVEFIGFLSALFAGNIKQAYHNLTLPPLSPPDSLFGIVWPFLYLLIGISGYMIFFKNMPRKTKVISGTLYFLQLSINFIWSIVFFGRNNYWQGFLWIIVLDLLVLSYILYLRNRNRIAAILFYPYFIWILFATYLSFGVAILN